MGGRRWLTRLAALLLLWEIPEVAYLWTWVTLLCPYPWQMLSSHESWPAAFSAILSHLCSFVSGPWSVIVLIFQPLCLNPNECIYVCIFYYIFKKYKMWLCIFYIHKCVRICSQLRCHLRPLSLLPFLLALQILEDHYHILPCSVLLSLNIPSSFFPPAFWGNNGYTSPYTFKVCSVVAQFT